MTRLAFARAKHQALRARLLAEDPDLDDQTLADTLEGLTDLNEIIAAILRAALSDEALAEGLRIRIAEMQGRLQRFSERASKRREIAREVMIEAEIKKILAPDLTVSLRLGSPGLTVTDEVNRPGFAGGSNS